MKCGVVSSSDGGVFVRYLTSEFGALCAGAAAKSPRLGLHATSAWQLVTAPLHETPDRGASTARSYYGHQRGIHGWLRLQRCDHRRCFWAGCREGGDRALGGFCDCRPLPGCKLLRGGLG
jgi:hypothetical protein